MPSKYLMERYSATRLIQTPLMLPSQKPSNTFLDGLKYTFNAIDSRSCSCYNARQFLGCCYHYDACEIF